MKTKLLLILALLLANASAHAQAVSALPLLDTPATNDFWNLLDVSDTSISANGRQKKVPVEAGIRLAETNLRSFSTTGTVYSAQNATFGDGNGTRQVFIVGTNTLASRLNLTTPNTANGWTIERNGDSLGQPLRFGRLEYGNTALYLTTNGAVKVGAFSAPATTLDVAGTITGTGVNNTGNTTLGDASGDTLTVPATGSFTGLQTFQQIATVENNHGNQSTAFNANVSTNDHRFTATGDTAITMTGTWPTTAKRTIAVVQDGTGGRTPTISPTPANGQPTVDETANAVTWITVLTFNGGSTIYALSSYVTPGGGGTGNDQGVRSEFIPVGYMRDNGVNSPAAAVNTTSGNGIVETRLFNDPDAQGLNIVWQRPRDCVDAVAGGDFQLKWRWVGVAPAAGLSSDTIALTLKGVGKATGDDINSTYGSAASSTLSSATHAAADVVYGSWSEITFTSTTEGWVSFLLELDTATSTDDLRLSGIELLYAVNLDAVTYASP